MSASGNEFVQWSVGEDHVATMTLNRPEKLNGINADMLAEIKRLWGVARDDDQIHCVVVRAAGERAFSTGLDRQAGFKYPDNIWNKPDPGMSLDPKHQRCWKPVIAAVNGMCSGGGLYLINTADIIICSENATFFDTHVDFGIVGALEPIGLAYRMPLGEVLRMFLLGVEERMSAARAHQMGLVSEILPPETLWARAQELARKIAAKPSVATQGTVKAIWEGTELARSRALENGFNYTTIGNPIGIAQVENMLQSGKRLPFEVR